MYKWTNIPKKSREPFPSQLSQKKKLGINLRKWKYFIIKTLRLQRKKMKKTQEYGKTFYIHDYCESGYFTKSNL